MATPRRPVSLGQVAPATSLGPASEWRSKTSLLLLPPAPAPLQAMQYPPFAFSLYHKPNGQGTLAYKVLGKRNSKTPLVLIHGLSAVGLVDWLPLAQSISNSRPVLIFDNRGIGASVIPKEREKDSYDVQDMANDAIDLIKHLGWKEVNVLGFSMGGMIAQTLLVTPQLPFKIHHAILAATSAKPAHSDLLAAIPSPSASQGPMTLEQKKELVRPFIYIGYDPDFVKDPKNKALLERRILESVETRRPAKTVAKQVQVIAGYDVRSKYSRIPSSLPILIIHGNLDKSVYFSERKYIERGLPQARIARPPTDAFGHMWYDYFTTDYWTALLEDFMEGREERVAGNVARL